MGGPTTAVPHWATTRSKRAFFSGFMAKKPLVIPPKKTHMLFMAAASAQMCVGEGTANSWLHRKGNASSGRLLRCSAGHRNLQPKSQGQTRAKKTFAVPIASMQPCLCWVPVRTSALPSEARPKQCCTQALFSRKHTFSRTPPSKKPRRLQYLPPTLCHEIIACTCRALNESHCGNWTGTAEGVPGRSIST